MSKLIVISFVTLFSNLTFASSDVEKITTSFISALKSKQSENLMMYYGEKCKPNERMLNFMIHKINIVGYEVLSGQNAKDKFREREFPFTLSHVLKIEFNPVGDNDEAKDPKEKTLSRINLPLYQSNKKWLVGDFSCSKKIKIKTSALDKNFFNLTKDLHKYIVYQQYQIALNKFAKEEDAIKKGKFNYRISLRISPQPTDDDLDFGTNKDIFKALFTLKSKSGKVIDQFSTTIVKMKGRNYANYDLTAFEEVETLFVDEK